MFQIVRCILGENGEVAARQPLQPLFDLWEDATAIAEFDSSRLSGDYGYDEARDCWWASDSLGRDALSPATALEAQTSTPSTTARLRTLNFECLET